jgi:hypothetical protein
VKHPQFQRTFALAQEAASVFLESLKENRRERATASNRLVKLKDLSLEDRVSARLKREPQWESKTENGFFTTRHVEAKSTPSAGWDVYTSKTNTQTGIETVSQADPTEEESKTIKKHQDAAEQEEADLVRTIQKTHTAEAGWLVPAIRGGARVIKHFSSNPSKK